ncbi:hypothetical protein NDA14_003249 [Ustilago hordei]|nr:hypothetical protein NDA14_003249 [Ustilago hordei]
MKDEASSQQPQAPPADNTSSPPARTPSQSARHSRIRQSAPESSAPISFARPLHLRQDTPEPAFHGQDISTGSSYGRGIASEDSEWNDEPPSSATWDRRAANASGASDPSDASTPLKVRRRGMINDKKLTISVHGPPKASSSSLRVASDSSTPAIRTTPPTEMPARRTKAATRSRSYRSDNAAEILPSKSKKDSPTGSAGLGPQTPDSAGIRWAPAKSSPLADATKFSPIAATTSPGSSGQSSGGGSDKPLLSTPRYGFNPEFALGASTTSKSKDDTPPAKPSPTYNGGSSQGGVKSMLYANRMLSTPLSPRAPIDRSPMSNKMPSTPRTPQTPRTPVTARLPQTPRSAGGASYQGVLLTTVTHAPSDPKVPMQGSIAESSTAAARKTSNRSASIATELRSFVRGGANEVIPRLELRVLQRPSASQFYAMGGPQGQGYSLAATARQTDEKEEGEEKEGQDQDYSPRTSAFARSQALSQLTRKLNSVSGKPVLRRGSSAMSRRVSMPNVTNDAKSYHQSSVDLRMSLAPTFMRGRRDSSMQPDNEDETKNDIVDEMNRRVHNITDAKRWILTHRPSIGNHTTAQDIMEEKRPATAMRRPTYAASVFQQARLMEAERQASVAAGAILSGSAINDAPVNESAANVGHLPPGTPSPLGPRTPELFFPKTPATAFPQGILEVEEPNPLGDPVTVAVSVHPLQVQPLTWKQQTLHYICTPGRLVKQQIDSKYVMSMCDLREILFPITFRKVALWFIYGGVITLLVLLDKHYHWWDKLDRAVHGKNLAIMGVLYGFEPMMIIVIMLVARVPDARVVPDRTVLVPRGSDSTDSYPVQENGSRHSISNDDSNYVAPEDMAAQMYSTILEEEHGDSQSKFEGGSEIQDQESGIVDREGLATKRWSAMTKPSMRRLSTRVTIASANTGDAPGGERRPSEATSNSHNAPPVPRTPGFDPKNRRSTIILHEPINFKNIGPELEKQMSRRPSDPSHQMMLARTASRDSRRGSYFGIVAASAGARFGATTPAQPTDAIIDEKEGKDLLPTNSTSSNEIEDEKKAIQSAAPLESSQPDAADIGIDMDTFTHPSLTCSTALIIPCHNADVEVLKAVLFAALVHFEPWQISIVDNGNSPLPPRDMESTIRSQPMFSRVNYIWLPVGNKNIAQFVGAKAAAVLNLDYVLTIDDDVIVPANFAAPMHIISETVTAVCYPITAVDHRGDRPLFVGWQDIEYKMSALAKMAESKMCSVLFPHGAASFWKRETMIAILRRHDLIYFADDVKMGLELQALGQRMGIDGSISFETVAPETFLGPPTNGTANYYHQRVRSWEMARHTLYWQFSKRFLFSLNGARTPVAIGWQKFTQFYNSTTNFIDWIRLPMFVLLGGSGQFWLRSFAFIFFLPIVPLLPYRFIKTRNRPDLHPHMLDMLTFGIYKLMYSLVCILGGLRSMLVFFPNHSHKPNLVEMEKKGDERCIWLKENFMKDSGGQGDLRGEGQQILLDDEATAQTQAEAEREGEEMTKAAVVNTLTAEIEKQAGQQDVAVVNVARRPSRTPHDEQTAHEVR